MWNGRCRKTSGLCSPLATLVENHLGRCTWHGGTRPNIIKAGFQSQSYCSVPRLLATWFISCSSSARWKIGFGHFRPLAGPYAFKTTVALICQETKVWPNLAYVLHRLSSMTNWGYVSELLAFACGGKNQTSRNVGATWWIWMEDFYIVQSSGALAAPHHDFLPLSVQTLTVLQKIVEVEA